MDSNCFLFKTQRRGDIIILMINYKNVILTQTASCKYGLEVALKLHKKPWEARLWSEIL